MSLLADEERRNWREAWLGSLAELSDIDVQQRWIDPRVRMPHWTFREFVNSYYDHVWDGDYEPLIERGLVSAAEKRCIDEFHLLLHEYEPPKGDYFDNLAVLRDPMWQKTVAVGRRSIQKLAELLVDPADKAALLDPPRPLDEGDFTWPNGTRSQPIGP